LYLFIYFIYLFILNILGEYSCSKISFTLLQFGVKYLRYLSYLAQPCYRQAETAKFVALKYRFAENVMELSLSSETLTKSKSKTWQWSQNTCTWKHWSAM